MISIDEHWATVCGRAGRSYREATACTATVWPAPANSPEAISTGPTLAEQERIRAELESTSGSFQRLKLVMDAWCALVVLATGSRRGFADAGWFFDFSPPIVWRRITFP